MASDVWGNGLPVNVGAVLAGIGVLLGLVAFWLLTTPEFGGGQRVGASTRVGRWGMLAGVCLWGTGLVLSTCMPTRALAVGIVWRAVMIFGIWSVCGWLRGLHRRMPILCPDGKRASRIGCLADVNRLPFVALIVFGFEIAVRADLLAGQLGYRSSFFSLMESPMLFELVFTAAVLWVGYRVLQLFRREIERIRGESRVLCWAGNR